MDKIVDISLDASVINSKSDKVFVSNGETASINMITVPGGGVSPVFTPSGGLPIVGTAEEITNAANARPTFTASSNGELHVEVTTVGVGTIVGQLISY